VAGVLTLIRKVTFKQGVLRMEKLKEVNIKVKNISPKQWSIFLIELNLMKNNWKKFGPEIDIFAKNLDKIIRWGQKKHGESGVNDEEIIHEPKGNGSSD
jgi:hypothetical protein